MYLKSIEVNGFKSFANKIDFRFEKGITGIVGPNGSGKSNVADAVRWVLGEQSASKLRGSKMEDVIFSGTELRKPQAAAYVAITLDNSDHSLPIDYNEVTVARRVYRSGESEYLINGNVTRLKDVTSLFFDTGIGKEGYSIIGQGQIERILSDKPDDRRALFDEAAGIVKYKKNKLITEKQLDAEHANLNRVNDIISGLEDRVEPLRKQSEKAKIYLELKDRQKTLDINSFLLQIDKIRDELDAKQNSLDITEAEINRLKEEFEYTKTEYDRLEESLEALNVKIENTKSVINEKKLENEHADGEIRVIKEKISSEGVINAEINAQIERLRYRVNEVDQKLQAAQSEKNNVKKTLSDKEAEASQIDKSRIEAETKETEVAAKIDTAKGDIIEFINEGGNLKEKIARYDTMLENINLRKTELKSKYLSSKSEQAIAESDRKTLQDEMDSINASLEKNNSKLVKCDADLRAISERESSVKANIQKYNQTVISLRSRVEILRNMTERYEGYGQSIKKVMEKKATDKKIIGVVADIITVDKDYEIAIETALGASIQNIVTEDETTAKNMIAYLRTNKLGRATFLPITSIVKRGSVNPDVLDEHGVIGIASKLVSADKKFENIIESLLGRSIVVDNIDNAIKLARKYNQTLRLVTPEGDLINPGGAMTGGAFKNSSNLLGRKRELEDIQKQIGETNNLLRKAKEEETSLKMKKDSLRSEKDNLNNLIQKLSIDHNSVTIGLKNVEERISNINNSFASIKTEDTQLNVQIEQIDENKKNLFDTEKQHESSITERETMIARWETELAEKRDIKHKIEEKLSSINLELAGIKQNLSHFDSDINRLKAEKEEYNIEIKTAEGRLEGNANSVQNLEAELEKLHTSKQQNDSIINDELMSLEDLVKEKDNINKNHKDFFEKREKLSDSIHGLEKSSYTLKLALEKLEEERDSASNYMWEEYELTYSSAELLKNPELSDPVALKKEINSIKQKIKSLGDVNVNAIEEFKEVSERYTFLSTQRDDIIDAENNLKGIIADLDRAMKETFAEKFRDIQNMFSKVFKELFGGGKASLTLVDEDDLLETGIIINAQPPGKKLQNMMQLSGGEKSLTAISLLFAIQSLKPSPFCILDEIEAALDDSNVGRFAHYLDKLTKHTQFVVITHRKGTMEAANRLYGITMQEKGVSTLVSVNLIEDKLDE